MAVVVAAAAVCAGAFASPTKGVALEGAKMHVQRHIRERLPWRLEWKTIHVMIRNGRYSSSNESRSPEGNYTI